MSTEIVWIEPHKDIERGHFRTLIKDLEALLPSVRRMRPLNDFDKLVIRLMEGWLAHVSGSYPYQAFADFADQWTRHDPRLPLKQLRALLFPSGAKLPILDFINHAGCWTFGLDGSERQKAASGFACAKDLVKTAVRRLQSRDDYVNFLCSKYFGDAQLWTISDLETRFVRLKAAFDDNVIMDVLCKGSEERAGERALGYVDPAGDAQVRHDFLVSYSRCTYLTDRCFSGASDQDQGHKLFSAQYHLKFGTTVLHEMTHHILGTDDERINGQEAYGRGKCIALAAKNAVAAMNNADSLAIFARDLALYDLGFKLDDHL